jgi:hypothetical protein
MLFKIGPLISSSSSRDVFENSLDSSTVVKKTKSLNDRNGNKTEWLIWNAIKDTSFAPWFCPVQAASSDFEYLIMTKAGDASVKFREWLKSKGVTSRRLPNNAWDDIPDSLKHDTERAPNWGLINNRLVIIDYGCHKNLLYLNEILVANDSSPGKHG